MFCQNCGAQIDDNARFCPSCGQSIVPPPSGPENEKGTFSTESTISRDVPPPQAARITTPEIQPKKKKGCLGRLLGVFLVLILIGIAINAIGGGSSSKTSSSSSSNTSASSNSSSTSSAKSDKSSPSKAINPTPTPKEFYSVGDTIQDGDVKIVYMASGEYSSDNQFIQPAEGKKYIFLEFAFINEGTKDESVSFYSFDGYADGYAVDMHYFGEENLSATLSAGRSTSGKIYYEVPRDAQEIEVEYSPNVFLNNKIRFLYEGTQDSGFVLEANSSRKEGALQVGDIYEEKSLKITYLSCDPYNSDNQFIQPKSGNTYYSILLEFENTGSSDRSISTFSFDCYADGRACEQCFSRDDDISATISAGRKAKGTVTFEIPNDAQVVEIEFNNNIWTSNRIVFTVR